jgi:NAD(P)-dependent dehydrogenase (short-subunit alcohol dehydrogenase family)
MRELDGKTAMVAGGSTLIGQSVAETLAGYGCNVVIADINVADGEAHFDRRLHQCRDIGVAAAATKLGGKTRFMRCDLTKSSSRTRTAYSNQVSSRASGSAYKGILNDTVFQLIVASASDLKP